MSSTQYIYRIALFNDMAFKILDRLGCENPTEEQLRLVERMLSLFIIIPLPWYDQLKINFYKYLNDLNKKEKIWDAKNTNSHSASL